MKPGNVERTVLFLGGALFAMVLMNWRYDIKIQDLA
jgi:hypothetical protein